MLNRIKNNTAGYVTIDYPWVDLANPDNGREFHPTQPSKMRTYAQFHGSGRIEGGSSASSMKGTPAVLSLFLMNNGLLPE